VLSQADVEEDDIEGNISSFETMIGLMKKMKERLGDRFWWTEFALNASRVSTSYPTFRKSLSRGFECKV
jgi:hypothetical protein